MMCSDGSLRATKDCGVTQSAASQKSGKGKGRAGAAAAAGATLNTAGEVELEPRLYMGFLMRFIHKELFIRNTQQSVDEEYGKTQVLTDIHRQTHTDTHTDRENCLSGTLSSQLMKNMARHRYSQTYSDIHRQTHTHTDIHKYVYIDRQGGQ